MAETPLAADRAQVLGFTVAGKHFALPADQVAEVIRPRVLTRVPNAPASLLGVTNLRGTVLPVLSLAGLLGRDSAAPAQAARIVVTRRAASTGLLVDEVTSLAPAADEPCLDLDALLAREFGSALRRPTGTILPRRGSDEREAPGADRDQVALLTFELAAQSYALPLDAVIEVASLPSAGAMMPSADEAIAGVVSFRERLLPLLSLHALLAMPKPVLDHGSTLRIVVCRIGLAPVGLLVDRLDAILRVPGRSMEAVPAVLSRGTGEAQIEAICRLDRRLISVLSPAKLFDPATAARLLAHSEQDRTKTDEDDAAMSNPPEGSESLEQFVVFQLGEETYGLPIAAVDEVVRCPASLTRIPRAPTFVQGVMNLRGKVVPVIDQRQRFGAPGGEPVGRRVIVVTIGPLQAGFVVDGVSDVLGIPTGDLANMPELASGDAGVFDRVAMVEREGRMILLIEAKALLDRAEQDLLAAMATPVSDAPEPTAPSP